MSVISGFGGPQGNHGMQHSSRQTKLNQLRKKQFMLSKQVMSE